MANVPLKSIKFPGLSDTYTVPQIDNTLATAGKAADAKAAGDVVKVSSTQPTEATNKLWVKDQPGNEYTVPLYSEFEELKSATETIYSPNVFNPEEIISGYQIYAVSDGKAYANQIAFVSGFIPVSAGDVVRRYRRMTESTYYGPGSCNFDGIAEYSSANENTYIRGSNSVNPYTVQNNGYIRFWSRLEQLDSDYVSAVYINREANSASEIEPYYVRLYPISNPQVIENTSNIETLTEKCDALEATSANDVGQYYSPFYKFPMLASVRSDFYYQNILYGNYDKFIGAYTGNSLFTEHKDSFSITPSESSGLTGFNPVFMNNTKYDNPLTGYVALQVVKTTDGQNKTPKVLLIGDSMTEQGKYQNYANQYLSDNGTSVTWLGSRTSEYGLHHEGRSGWRAYTYTHFASTTAGDGEGTATTNAFWNPSTNSFDFAYYMQQQGYSSVDIVFINLGTNDFARSNHITVDDVKTAWQTMIDSIHSYNSNIKIVLWLCPMPCLMNGANRSARYTYKMHRVIIDNFMGNAWGYQNVWIMPSYLVLDPVYGFPYSQVPRNQYDETLTDEPTDTIHPSDSGYHQLANPVSAMIKYLVKD